MTGTRWIAAAIACVVALVPVTGCGGGDNGDGGTTASADDSEVAVPAAILARANTNCRQAAVLLRRLTKGAVKRYPLLSEAVNEGVVRPGLSLMERQARRQGALAAAADNPDFDRYVELYQPMIVLTRQFLQAARAHNIERAKRLAALVTGLRVEQRLAARAAGLTDCDVDLVDVIEKSSSP
jgi:hypothetical protein